MVETAQAHNPNTQRIRFVHGKAEDLRPVLPDSSVDLLTSGGFNKKPGALSYSLTMSMCLQHKLRIGLIGSVFGQKSIEC